MDLRSPSTLLAAWVLAPLLTVIAAGGLGLGAAALTRYRLGAMTLPLGYAAGIVLMVVLLELGLGGTATVVVTAVAAVAGYAAHWSDPEGNAGARPPRRSAAVAAGGGGGGRRVSPGDGSARGQRTGRRPRLHPERRSGRAFVADRASSGRRAPARRVRAGVVVDGGGRDRRARVPAWAATSGRFSPGRCRRWTRSTSGHPRWRSLPRCSLWSRSRCCAACPRRHGRRRSPPRSSPPATCSSPSSCRAARRRS